MAARVVQPTDDGGQHAVIEAAADRRILVEAGPGTGKTHTAALRLAKLVRSDVSPAQILVLSFSRSAVRTLTNRLAKVASADDNLVEELRHISIRTFDSWAFRMLRLLGDNAEGLLARTHDENIAALTEMIVGPGRDAVRQLIGNRRHLIVDEFQDLPGVRGELVVALLDLLAPPDDDKFGFTILGDPAQAIYGFTAQNANGRAFPSPTEYWNGIIDRYGEGISTVRLSHNYRSDPPIAKLATRLRTVLLSDVPVDEKIGAVKSELEALPECKALDMESFPVETGPAILARTNGEALRVLTKLMGKELVAPAVLHMRAAGFASLSPAWIAGLLRQVKSPTVIRSQFERIYTHLGTLWGEETCRRLSLPTSELCWTRLTRAAGAGDDASEFSMSELRDRLNWPDAFPDDMHDTTEGLVISTVHQSKGMEFDDVTVLEKTLRRKNNAQNDDAHSDEDEPDIEEANIGYVAVTRAGKSLNRLPAKSIYTPPTYRDFQDGRRRLCTWWNRWINLEMGQNGDIDPLGFVDPELLGRGGALELQQYLLENADALTGRKVILCKDHSAKHVRWKIHLQTDELVGRLLGVTSPQLTFDLLDILHSKGYSLPYRIMNLRISGVGTITSSVDRSLDAPESVSRLWLGVSLYGTGDFKPSKTKKA